jgi:hypothetical protein
VVEEFDLVFCDLVFCDLVFYSHSGVLVDVTWFDMEESHFQMILSIPQLNTSIWPDSGSMSMGTLYD